VIEPSNPLTLGLGSAFELQHRTPPWISQHSHRWNNWCSSYTRTEVVAWTRRKIEVVYV